MRVMVMVKADRASESGVLPSGKELAEMGRFNEELVKAGVMLAGEGLHPSSKGKRIHFAKGRKTVVDGPFAETKELIAGWWLWKVGSVEEAVEWVKRSPFRSEDAEGFDVEIRPVFEEEDFGEAFTPELREQEAHLRKEMAAKQGAGKR